jgi:hypothetical protein
LFHQIYSPPKMSPEKSHSLLYQWNQTFPNTMTRAVKSKSNRIWLSNRNFLLESNQIVCRSNRMYFSIFDTIRFDSIWTPFWGRKN